LGLGQSPETDQGSIIDEAIHSLWVEGTRPVRTDSTPIPDLLTSDRIVPVEISSAHATLLSPEPVQRQEGPSFPLYEDSPESLTGFAVSLLIAAFVARRIDPPGTKLGSERVNVVLPHVR
jgi:hypothetical protein